MNSKRLAGGLVAQQLVTIQRETNLWKVRGLTRKNTEAASPRDKVGHRGF
jgi:hypothetical protein